MKQDVHGFDDIWASTKPRLEEYKQKFIEEWSRSTVKSYRDYLF